MILGTGIDIIEINRVSKAVQQDGFRQRVFTVLENEYCQARGRQSASSYAARFAAKEAVLKAFGTGLRNGTLHDIEIYNDELGCPKVRLSGFYAKLAEQKKIAEIYVSLSHAREYATAQVIFWGEQK